MLLGKNGAAKRALGNSILGRKAFPAKPDIAIIHQCKGINGRSQGNRNVTVFDSLEIQNTLDMAHRLNTCLHWVGPSPHVFLYIADPGERVCNGIHFIRESLGRAVTRFTIVVFTGVRTGDEKNLWQGVKCLVGGHHVFSGDLHGNSEQISVLMDKIDTLMRKHLGYKSVKKTHTDVSKTQEANNRG